jgi:type IV pilus assembly protein PilM
LLTAAPKNLVKRYIEIFTAAEIQIVSLETEAFALERALIGLDKSSVMIVDMGALATDISVIQEGIPLLNRSIDVGGDTITKAIANSLNINIERAEQFKRDFGLSVSETSATKIRRKINQSRKLFYQADLLFCRIFPTT